MKNPFIVAFSVIAVFLAVMGFILLADGMSASRGEYRPLLDESAVAHAIGADVLVEGLSIPWDIAFLPGGKLLVTERAGRVLHVDTDGTLSEVHVENVTDHGEGGLLGIALHPNFVDNRFVYLYMSTTSPGGGTENRVVRYRYEDNTLSQGRVIIDGIPGATYHDGGRIEFGADGFLYITTGDATEENLAQDKSSLAGKILRVDDDGTISEGNPFSSAVYSYGHRNPQGLAWDSDGRLWATEHGRSGVRSGFDEINLIQAGSNYGWPDVEGSERKEGMVAPARHSGENDTWAPASAAYLGGSIFFGGLRGEALYEAVLSGDRITEVKEHYKGEFGRVRTVRVGPDGMLYITTSNMDGRGSPAAGDDRIIRINPAQL